VDSNGLVTFTVDTAPTASTDTEFTWQVWASIPNDQTSGPGTLKLVVKPINCASATLSIVGDLHYIG
jgi:hypothetical protein